jgi:hypothetical protein
MTEDAANRQKAEKSGLTSNSGLLPALTEFFVPFFMFFIVRKYVEGMVDSTQHLDLLAAVKEQLLADKCFVLMCVSPIIYLFLV